MTLKSKKLYSTQCNKRNNIKSKMHGGSKFTVIGHEREDSPNESDVYIVPESDEHKHLFSETDVKLVNSFLKNFKGADSDHFEFTNLSGFIKKLQDNMSFIYSEKNTPEEKVEQLVKEDGETTIVTGKDDTGADITKTFKNYEINLEFVKKILNHISGTGTDAKLSDDERKDPETMQKREMEKRDGSGSEPASGKIFEKDKLFDIDGDHPETAYKETMRVDNQTRIRNTQVIIDDLRQVYKQYLDKYTTDTQGIEYSDTADKIKQYNDPLEKDALSDNFIRTTNPDVEKGFKLTQGFQQNMTSKLDSPNPKNFKTMEVTLNDDEKYYFSDEDDSEGVHHLKDKFEGETAYSDKANFVEQKKVQNIKELGSLGVGQDEDLEVETEGATAGTKAYVSGKLGFELTTLYSDKVKERYEWCYLMERIYLFKHLEILQLTINISYLMNSLFIIYYFFSKIVKLRDISGRKCPIPKKVVLPPTYKKLIETYFQTQRTDLDFMNRQITSVVKEINGIINKNPNTPNEYKNFVVAPDFSNRPMGYLEYSKLIMSGQIHKSVYYFYSELATVDLKTKLENDFVVDVQEMTIDTYFLNETGDSVQLPKNKEGKKLYEVLVIRSNADGNLNSLENKILTIDTEYNKSFVSGNDKDITGTDNATSIENPKIVKTRAVLVNLKPLIQGTYNINSYQTLINTFMTKLNEKLPDKNILQDLRIIYVDVYKNQLKIIYGLSNQLESEEENIALEINKEQFITDVFNQDTGFETLDNTKEIVYTSRVMSGGSLGRFFGIRRDGDGGGDGEDAGEGEGAGLEIDETTDLVRTRQNLMSENNETDLKLRTIEAYEDSGQSPIGKDESFENYNYEYESDEDEKKKIPYSLKKKMVDEFLNIDIISDLNPYKIANDPEYYLKFRMTEEFNIQKYVSQLKNVKELVVNNQNNNEDLSSIIGMLSQYQEVPDINKFKENLSIDRTKSVRGTTDYDQKFEDKAMNYEPDFLEELPRDEENLFTEEHIQIYLNRCYELEKLYLVKHQEFLYLKNVFDKTFIFYLMTFIVFFYYLKTLGIEEIKECKDLKVKIPKTFLSDIQLMVKNQKQIVKGVQESSPFTTITQNILPNQPGNLMSGGGEKLDDYDLEEFLKSLIYIRHETGKPFKDGTIKYYVDEHIKKEGDAEAMLKYLEQLTKDEQIGTDDDNEVFEKVKKYICENEGVMNLDDKTKEMCFDPYVLKGDVKYKNKISIDEMVISPIDLNNALKETNKTTSFEEIRRKLDEGADIVIEQVKDNRILKAATLAELKAELQHPDTDYPKFMDIENVSRVLTELFVKSNKPPHGPVSYIDPDTYFIISTATGKKKLDYPISPKFVEAFLGSVPNLTDKNNVCELPPSGGDTINGVFRDLMESNIKKMKDLLSKETKLDETINRIQNMLDKFDKNKQNPTDAEGRALADALTKSKNKTVEDYKKTLLAALGDDKKTDIKSSPNGLHWFKNNLAEMFNAPQARKEQFNKIVSDEFINCIGNIVGTLETMQNKLLDLYKLQTSTKPGDNTEVTNSYKGEFKLENFFGTSKLPLEGDDLVIKLINTKYGTNDKTQTNKALLESLDDGNQATKDKFKGKTIGSILFTLYKEYHSFRALTAKCKTDPDGKGPDNAFINTLGDQEVPVLITAQEIIDMVHNNENVKKLFDHLDKFYIQTVTKGEWFIKSHYNNIKEPTPTLTGFGLGFDGDKQTTKSFINSDINELLTEVEITDNVSLINEISELINGTDTEESFFKRIAGFNEDNLGAARVYILIRDTGESLKQPPSGEYSRKYKKPLEDKLKELLGGVLPPPEDLDKMETSELIEAVRGAGINLPSPEFENYNERLNNIPDTPTTGGGDVDKENFAGFYNNLETSDDDPEKKSLRTFNGIGDTLLHPISDVEKDYTEGEEVDDQYATTEHKKKQIHNAQCVFMPDYKYIKQSQNEYTGYPTDNKDPKPNKVYGPFRKAFFHSKPGILFDNEFTDINKNIEDGKSVVFFGYGFSGSGKTYTLTNSSDAAAKAMPDKVLEAAALDAASDGFLKKIVKGADGRTIKEIEISEVYPYFPSFLECENKEEYENFDSSDIFNVKRIREKFPDYGTGKELEKENQYYTDGVDTRVLDKSGVDSDLVFNIDNDVNKTEYPIVKMTHFTYNAGAGPKIKHTLNVYDQGLSKDEASEKIQNLKFDDANISVKSFETLLNRINKRRKQLLQVSQTPNNPDSSRSHLFIHIKFINEGNLTIVDMAGAENTTQIQTQFLLPDIPIDDPDVGKTIEGVQIPGGTKLKFTTNNKCTFKYLVKNAGTGPKPMGQDGKPIKEISATEWPHETMTEKTFPSNISEELRTTTNMSTLTKWIYFCFCRLSSAKGKSWSFIQPLNPDLILFGVNLGSILADSRYDKNTTPGSAEVRVKENVKKLRELNKNVIGEKAPEGTRAGASVSTKKYLPEAEKNSVQQRYRHHFDGLGSSPFHAYNLLLVLTVIDIMLAMNLKPVGLASIHKLWSENKIKDCDDINERGLKYLIQNFEKKQNSTFGKASDNDKYISSGTNEASNIDYLSYFASGVDVTDKKFVLKKVIKKLDLEYLLDPEQLLNKAAALQDQFKPKAAAERARAAATAAGLPLPPLPSTTLPDKTIFSPFTWIYYCTKHILFGDLEVKKRDGDTEFSTKPVDNLFEQLILLKLVFGYISIIVDQGNGIVTSLEHLKYFFLFNTNGNEALYAYNMKQEDPRVRFIHDIETDSPPQDWDNTKHGDYKGFDLIRQKSVHPKTVKFKGKAIQEYVNKGHMYRVKMLETLRKYGGQCSDAADTPSGRHCDLITNGNTFKPLDNQLMFETIETKPTSELEKYKYVKKYLTDFKADFKDDKGKFRKFKVLDISTGSQAGNQNKYIMMAHIMRGAMGEDGYVTEVNRGKYCDATRATLEFASEIKSDVGLCPKINKSRWTNQPISDANCDSVNDIQDVNGLQRYLTGLNKRIEPDTSTPTEETSALLTPPSSRESSPEPGGQGGGAIMELLPTCSYSVVNFTPIKMKNSVSKLLGVTNTNNLYNRLKTMNRLLRRGKVNSKRATGKNYRKRFRTKKCRR
jgi:hypothetical protein